MPPRSNSPSRHSAVNLKGGLIVQPDGITLGHRQLIIDLAARHGLPAVYPFRVFAMEGGLMAYGIQRRRSVPWCGIVH